MSSGLFFSGISYGVNATRAVIYRDPEQECPGPMIGASVQHTLNFRNLAFQNFYFVATQVYVCKRNLRIAFQCSQKLPEPHQIDIEWRFDHAAIIFSHRLAKSSYPLTKCI